MEKPQGRTNELNYKFVSNALQKVMDQAEAYEEQRELLLNEWIEYAEGLEEELENSEDAPLYHIAMPNGCFLARYRADERNVVFSSVARYSELWQTTFTEAEIKALDERYWPFAVLVEEGDTNE